jgi:hypothetical protein
MHTLTVPPRENHRVAVRLGWRRIVIVASGDAFGADGLAELLAMAASRSINVVKSFVMPTLASSGDVWVLPSYMEAMAQICKAIADLSVYHVIVFGSHLCHFFSSNPRIS